jgi:HK97 gp10 family phage protein
MALNIKIEGLEDLAGMLEKVKATARGNEIRAALLDGANLIRGQAQANAPRAPYATYYQGRMIEPGGLRKSLQAAAGRQFKNFLQAYAYAVKLAAPHAHLVEFGTKRHTIVPKDKKKLVFGNRFKRFASRVTHPGSRPIPFFRNAIRSQRNNIKRLLESRVKAAFDALGRAA